MAFKYETYINSKEWLEKSERYLKEYPICEICHKHKATQVHHTSYKNIGKEKRRDLLGVCDRCHTHLHLLPPKIEDKVRLAKAEKLIETFIQYPALKTLAFNELMEKYYPGENYMIDLASRVCDDTAFFMQNVMEMLDADSEEKGTDLIEELSRIVYLLKMKAGKNKMLHDKEKAERKRKYENGDYDYMFTTTTTDKVKQTVDEVIKNRRKNFCLSELASRPILGEAMRWANITFYEGQMFFKRSGIVTSAQFYLEAVKKGFDQDLFEHLGGTLNDLVGDVDA